MYTMTDQEFKNIIHTLVVPENLPAEEKEKRYQPLTDFLKSYTPEKLFRFRSCKERSFKEFDQDILGFSPASEMNDDFDGMLYFDKKLIRTTLTNSITPQTITKFIESVQQGRIPVEIKNYMQDDVLKQIIGNLSNIKSDSIDLRINKFINFVMEDYDERMTFLSQVTQNQKIACLSSSIESATMWGYYANNGTGFALSYDLRGACFSKDYCLVPVIYGEDRFNTTEYGTWLMKQLTFQRILMKINTYSLNPLIQHIIPLIQRIIPCPDTFMHIKVLIHKASSWSHENEWRLIFCGENGQSEKYPHISKKPTALYLGRNISTIHEKILRNIAVEKNIPTYKMMICEDSQTYSLYPQLF